MSPLTSVPKVSYLNPYTCKSKKIFKDLYIVHLNKEKEKVNINPSSDLTKSLRALHNFNWKTPGHTIWKHIWYFASTIYFFIFGAKQRYSKK